MEKPSTETTATTFSISGNYAQHEQVAMVMYSVTMETRYIPEKQYSDYINGNTYNISLQECQFWKEIHKLEPKHGQVTAATFGNRYGKLLHVRGIYNQVL